MILGTVTRSEYDLSQRPIRKTVENDDSHEYTAEVFYDDQNNLQKFREEIGAQYIPYETSYTWDVEHKPKSVVYGGSSVQYGYDGMQRLNERILQIDNNHAVKTKYTYIAGGYDNNSTTGLIETIAQLGGVTKYHYDANGNIIRVDLPNGTRPTSNVSRLLHPCEEPHNTYHTGDGISIKVYDHLNSLHTEDGSAIYTGNHLYIGGKSKTVKSVTYNYDQYGQLTRVNDPYDQTASIHGTTWIYTYDLGGNILKKSAYQFTEQVVSTPIREYIYVYDDDNWKDKLTSFDGHAITYDAIGNPLNDRTWSYTWRYGRQLAAMQSNNDSLSFLYNAEGLRVQKTSNITGTTKYILHGKNVVHLVNDDHDVINEMHFYYDSQNRPAIVEWNGNRYGYLYNLQNDIIALVDNGGNKVVEYYYDAWGKILKKGGLLADTLGTIQPFRYRGYVYDEETGLYYLRSRYYNPLCSQFVNADILVRQSISIFEYCRCCPTRFLDMDGAFEACAYTITPEYYNYLQAVFDYSIEHANDTLVIPVDVFDAKTKQFAALHYSHEQFDCAYSIAKCLEPASSATGMTKMVNNYAVAMISIEAAGGEGPHLLDYSILAMYDSNRIPKTNPWHHGGILNTYPMIYESCASHGFSLGLFSDQVKGGGWTHLFWHKGVKLTGKLLK